MKKHIYFICLLSLTSVTFSQNWLWAKKIDKGAEEIGTSVGVDKQNNLYVVGSTAYYTGGGGSYYYPLFYKFNSSGNLLWTDTLAFSCEKSATDSIGNTFMASGNFIAKYNNSGQKLWIQNVPNGFFRNICLNPLSGFIVVGSTYVGSNCRTAIYSFDSNGNILWNRIGDFASGGSIPNSINCDKDGNIYWVGQDVRNDTLVGFIARIDLAGNLTYTQEIPGLPTNVVVTNDLNIYINGYYNIYSSNPPVYITKYNQQGNTIWFKLISGVVTYPNTAIATDKNNNLYLTGSYHSLQIDSVNLTSNTEEVFVLMADSGGNVQWIEHSSGMSGQSVAYTRDILVNSSNDIFIIGGASDSHSFGSSVLNCNSYPDMLLAKLSHPTNNAIASLTSKNNTELSIYPNPVSDIFYISYSSPEKTSLQLNITNAKGQTVYTETILKFAGEYNKEVDLSKQAKGIYFVEIIADRKRTTRKIVVD